MTGTGTGNALARLEGTIDVLRDPQGPVGISEADTGYARGDVLQGTDAVRELRR